MKKIIALKVKIKNNKSSVYILNLGLENINKRYRNTPIAKNET